MIIVSIYQHEQEKSLELTLKPSFSLSREYIKVTDVIEYVRGSILYMTITGIQPTKEKIGLDYTISSRMTFLRQLRPNGNWAQEILSQDFVIHNLSSFPCQSVKTSQYCNNCRLPTIFKAYRDRIEWE